MTEQDHTTTTDPVVLADIATFIRDSFPALAEDASKELAGGLVSYLVSRDIELVRWQGTEAARKHPVTGAYNAMPNTKLISWTPTPTRMVTHHARLFGPASAKLYK